jgi:hypothetical protein
MSAPHPHTESIREQLTRLLMGRFIALPINQVYAVFAKVSQTAATGTHQPGPLYHATDSSAEERAREFESHLADLLLVQHRELTREQVDIILGEVAQRVDLARRSVGAASTGPAPGAGHSRMANPAAAHPPEPHASHSAYRTHTVRAVQATPAEQAAPQPRPHVHHVMHPAPTPPAQSSAVRHDATARRASLAPPPASTTPRSASSQAIEALSSSRNRAFPQTSSRPVVPTQSSPVVAPEVDSYDAGTVVLPSEAVVLWDAAARAVELLPRTPDDDARLRQVVASSGLLTLALQPPPEPGSSIELRIDSVWQPQPLSRQLRCDRVGARGATLGQPSRQSANAAADDGGFGDRPPSDLHRPAGAYPSSAYRAARPESGLHRSVPPASPTSARSDTPARASLDSGPNRRLGQPGTDATAARTRQHSAPNRTVSSAPERSHAGGGASHPPSGSYRAATDSGAHRTTAFSAPPIPVGQAAENDFEPQPSGIFASTGSERPRAGRLLLDESGQIGTGGVATLLMRYALDWPALILEVTARGERWRISTLEDLALEVATEPVQPEYSLEALVRQSGLGDAAKIDHAVDAAQRTGRPLADLLTEMGAIRFRELDAILTSRLRLMLARLLDTQAYSYRIRAYDRLDPSSGSQPVPFTHDLFHRVQHDVESLSNDALEDIFKARPAEQPALRQQVRIPLQRFPVPARELRFLEEHLKGREAVQTIVAKSTARRRPTLELLETLNRIGLIEWQRHDPAEMRSLRSRNAIDQKLVQLEKVDPFTILEMHWSGNEREVLDAYRKMVESLDLTFICERGIGDTVPVARRLLAALTATRDQLSTRPQREKFRATVIDDFERRSALELFEKQVDISLFKGDTGDAKALLERMIELDPTHRRAQRKLRGLLTGDAELLKS